MDYFVLCVVLAFVGIAMISGVVYYAYHDITIRYK
jgi:hypothetical protein